MKDVIYRKTLIQARDSEDGEAPTTVTLTRETNGYALILETYSRHPICLAWFTECQREMAVETAVDAHAWGREFVGVRRNGKSLDYMALWQKIQTRMGYT